MLKKNITKIINKYDIFSNLLSIFNLSSLFKKNKSNYFNNISYF